MTREQARGFLGENATDEQVNALLNAISADINHARGDSTALQEQITALNAELTNAKATIGNLETAASENAKIADELNRYREAETRRQAEQTAAAEEQRMAERFKAVSSNAAFVNSYTRDGVYAQFKAATKNAANVGRGDADVFAEIIKDKPDLMANPNQRVNVTGPTNIGNAALTLDAFKAMPLSEKMKWANNNPEAYAKMNDLIK